MYIPKEKWSKLENKAVKCIFISYKDDVKGYKLWNLENKSIAYSRDVVFRELKSDPKNEVT